MLGRIASRIKLIELINPIFKYEIIWFLYLIGLLNLSIIEYSMMEATLQKTEIAKKPKNTQPK
jgi:hypothetical protein